MTSFLLEIGTEEMPASFLQQAISQLNEKVKYDFDRVRLTYEEILCTCTPRRLILFVSDISLYAKDIIKEQKGPPVSSAFIDGEATKAAIGFATRCGLTPDQLEVKQTNKGKFVFAKSIEKGKSTEDLLADLIPCWIDSLQGKRFMKWGRGERKFSRPIRWIVSLLDEKLISFTLENCDPDIKTSNISRGHRLFEKEIVINSSDEYLDKLLLNGVEINRDKRKETIKTQISDFSLKEKCFFDLPNSLLEELTDLVEMPSLIDGDFDNSFLDLPPEILTMVMKVHQRYIPLYENNHEDINPLLLNSKGTILPKFLCISNGLNKYKQTVKKGNERVLKARLSDAKFFVKADLKISSESRLNSLKNVSFSNGLGTIYDRVKRIEWIVDLLLLRTIGPNVNSKNIKRSALLCKHDLVSQMVGEFPELEGVIGGKYLLSEGESNDVALSVLEHYLPRGTKDSIPSSDGGCLLSIGEKLELLLSIFSKGDRPSGSSDPFALRRAGNGILQILFKQKWNVNLDDLISDSLKIWPSFLPNININKHLIHSDLINFFRQRLISLLEENHIDIDIIYSLVGKNIENKNLLINPSDIFIRAKILMKNRLNGKLNQLNQFVSRASRLAEKSNVKNNILVLDDLVKKELFEKKSEYKMYEFIKTIEPIVLNNSTNKYDQLVNTFIQGTNVLSNFFDGDESVMVMTENLKIRQNRLNLLAVLRNQSLVLADFQEIKN